MVGSRVFRAVRFGHIGLWRIVGSLWTLSGSSNSSVFCIGRHSGPLVCRECAPTHSASPYVRGRHRRDCNHLIKHHRRSVSVRCAGPSNGAHVRCNRSRHRLGLKPGPALESFGRMEKRTSNSCRELCNLRFFGFPGPIEATEIREGTIHFGHMHENTSAFSMLRVVAAR